MKTNTTDFERLLRLERDNPEHYRFLRETPREHRHIPFVVVDAQPTLEEIAIAVFMTALFAVFCFLALSF